MKRFILIFVMMVLCASVTIQAETKKSEVKTEQVSNQESDKNPVVGKDKKGRTIHQGAKGGLYYWTTYKKGDKAGQVKKAYLSKAEKEEFYKTHPNVKRPAN